MQTVPFGGLEVRLLEPKPLGFCVLLCVTLFLILRLREISPTSAKIAVEVLGLTLVIKLFFAFAQDAIELLKHRQNTADFNNLQMA